MTWQLASNKCDDEKDDEHEGDTDPQRALIPSLGRRLFTSVVVCLVGKVESIVARRLVIPTCALVGAAARACLRTGRHLLAADGTFTGSLRIMFNHE